MSYRNIYFLINLKHFYQCDINYIKGELSFVSHKKTNHLTLLLKERDIYMLGEHLNKNYH